MQDAFARACTRLLSQARVTLVYIVYKGRGQSRAVEGLGFDFSVGAINITCFS